MSKTMKKVSALLLAILMVVTYMPMMQETAYAAKKAKKPAKVKISSAKASGKKITVKWTKVKGAKGYEILIAKNKKGTKSPLTYKAGKKASKKIIKKLKKGRYFVKVRAYKVIKGNTVYGKYSKAKKVNVK